MIVVICPRYSKKVHDEASPGCWCEPTVEWVEDAPGEVNYATITHHDEDATAWDIVTMRDEDLTIGFA